MTQSAQALAEIGTIRIVYRRISKPKHVRVSKKQKRRAEQSDSEDEGEEAGSERLLDEKAKKAQFGLSAGYVASHPVLPHLKLDTECRG